jgi:hypothetical protein
VGSIDQRRERLMQATEMPEWMHRGYARASALRMRGRASGLR